MARTTVPGNPGDAAFSVADKLHTARLTLSTGRVAKLQIAEITSPCSLSVRLL
jgi:hypothetical protein